MMNILIKKANLVKFFNNLDDYQIIGPVKRGTVKRFEPIEKFDDIYFEGQTTYSFKKFFLPDNETLLRFKDKKPIDGKPEDNKRIIILRPCDANALLMLDKIFLDENPDRNYMEKRKNTLVFVFKCKEPFENCFCDSLGTQDTTNFDLLFTDLDDKYIVTPGSVKGRELTSSKMFMPIIRDGGASVECQKTVEDLRRLDQYKNDPLWKENADKCINCNACISVCPTCACFDVNDEVDVNQKDGRRVRNWDYCHMQGFTRVAGGHVFRDDKVKRFQHRIYHKLKYFKERHGKHLCVGCGRCMNVCPADIDMVDIINNLGK